MWATNSLNTNSRNLLVFVFKKINFHGLKMLRMNKVVKVTKLIWFLYILNNRILRTNYLLSKMNIQTNDR